MIGWKSTKTCFIIFRRIAILSCENCFFLSNTLLYRCQFRNYCIHDLKPNRNAYNHTNHRMLNQRENLWTPRNFCFISQSECDSRERVDGKWYKLYTVRKYYFKITRQYALLVKFMLICKTFKAGWRVLIESSCNANLGVIKRNQLLLN